MFLKEKSGLELLASSASLRIPSVIAIYEGDDQSCLLLEYLESAPKKSNYWQNLGVGLARMHLITSHAYGLETDNFMGSLRQSNRYTESWVDFFTNERILPQVKLARDHGRIRQKEADLIETLCKKLPELINIERPALTHGDLWSGNIMTDELGEPVLIDPAVSFCHRETDIAMTTLFGWLTEEFYQSYTETLKLEPGWQERLDIYNLYPLLVHVNLFGGGYLSQVMQITKRFN